MIPGFMVNTGMKALGKTMGLMAMKGVAGDPTMRYIMSAIKGVPGGAFGKAKSAVSSNASDAPNIPPPSKTPYRNRQQNRIPAAALNGGGGGGGSMGGDPSQQMIGELQNIQGMLQGIDSNISSLNQGIDDLNNGLQNVADGNYNNANKSDAILSALEELQNIIGENGANANKSAKDALESMVETRNHIQNVTSGIVRPINKNLVNMAGILERIAAANESMLKIQRYAYGLNDGADIKASAIRKASKRVDPSDSKSMDKEAYNKEVLETQKRNIELQMNEEEDSLLYKLYKVTKDTSKSLVKTLAKDTIGLGKDIVTGTAKGAWKHFIRPFAEEHIGLVKTKLAARKEEKQKEMMDVYTQMIKNGDYESAKKLQTKLEKKGISESVLNLIGSKGISSDQAEAYMERIKTKNKATAFDNETRDAIVKGIPFLLSEILKAISGEEKVWNHEMDTLTSKDDYVKSKAAAAKQNLLDVQKSKKRTWFLRNKNMLQYNRDLDKAISDVNKSEVMAENNMGFVNLYDTAHEGIEKEYNEKGVKNQVDKYKRLRYLYGSHLGDNLWDIGKKIGKGLKATKDWTKEFVTGDYEIEEHDAKGLFERITDNDAVKMKYLLKSSGLNKEQEREALAQMMGSRNNSSSSLLSKIGNVSNLTILEENTTENNVLLNEIIDILLSIPFVSKRSRIRNKGLNKKLNQQHTQSNTNQIQQPIQSNTNQNIQPTQQNTQKIKHFLRNGKNNLINYYNGLSFGGGIVSIKNALSNMNPINKMSNSFNNIKHSLLNMNPLTNIKNTFAIQKEKLANKKKELMDKLNNSYLKTIAKRITSLDKETKNHNKWQRAKSFISMLLGGASKLLGNFKSLIGGIIGYYLWDPMKSFLKKHGKEILKKAGRALKDLAKRIGRIMLDGIKWVGEFFWDKIKVFGETVAEKFKLIKDGIVGGIKDLGKSISDKIIGVVDSSKKWLSETFSGIMEKMTKVVEPIKELGTKMSEGFNKLMGGITNFAKDIGSKIWEPIEWLGKKLWWPFEQILSWLKINVPSFGETPKNTNVTNYFDDTSKATKVADNVTDASKIGTSITNESRFALKGSKFIPLLGEAILVGEGIYNTYDSIAASKEDVAKRLGGLSADDVGAYERGALFAKSMTNTITMGSSDYIYENINKASDDLHSGKTYNNFFGDPSVTGRISVHDPRYNGTLRNYNNDNNEQKPYYKYSINDLENNTLAGKMNNTKVEMIPQNLTTEKSNPDKVITSLEANSSKLNDINQQQLEALIGIRDEIAKNNRIVQNITNNNTTNNVIAGSGNTSIRNSSSSNPVNYRDPKQGVKASSISYAAQVAAKS